MAACSDLPVADPPLIIPIFMPHLGCPHQCAFCNQRAITGTRSPPVSADHIHQEVNRYLRYARPPRGRIQISFFGGNFLGIGKTAAVTLLKAAQSFVDHGVVDSLRFSTRPDTIDPQTLDEIQKFSVSTIELGVQSMRDRVLKAVRRGHREKDTVDAAGRLKARGYEVGMQMMVGLPGDDDNGAMQTARRITALKPDFVRIYPTLVLKGSPLAAEFEAGRYHPMSLSASVRLVKRLFLYFQRQRVPVIRMGLQAAEGLAEKKHLIAGPYHPAFGHLVHAAVMLDALSAAIEKMASIPDPLVVTTHPRMISRVQGLKKENLSQLAGTFRLRKIILIQDNRLALNRLMVAGEPVVLPSNGY